MTTYNTGNPIGSTEVKDLYDNAQNLDEMVNNRTARSYDDRLGVPRKTWWGMEQDFQDALIKLGYVDIGDYAAGLEITARNQAFWKDGELYKAGAVLDLPYVTTGDWLMEEALFVAVGDQVLRQQLADSLDPANGAAMIGYRGETAFSALDRHQAIFDAYGFLINIDATGIAPIDETLQAALNARRVVRLPAGDFKMAKMVSLNSNNVLIGCGPEATRLFRDISADPFDMFSIVSKSDVCLRDLWLDSVQKETVGEAGTRKSAIRAWDEGTEIRCERLKFLNIRFDKFSNAEVQPEGTRGVIGVEQCDDVEISGCEFRDNRATCIYWWHASNVRVHDNYCLGDQAPYDPLWKHMGSFVSGIAEGVSVIGNRIKDTGYSSINASGNHIVISGNTIDSPGFSGIGIAELLPTARNVSITGNSVKNSKLDGIYIAECQDFVISGNVVTGVSEPTRAGIRIANPISGGQAGNGLISANTLIGNSLGVRIESGASIDIRGNLIKQNGSGVIISNRSTLSSGAFVSGNNFTDNAAFAIALEGTATNTQTAWLTDNFFLSSSISTLQKTAVLSQGEFSRLYLGANTFSENYETNYVETIFGNIDGKGFVNLTSSIFSRLKTTHGVPMSGTAVYNAPSIPAGGRATTTVSVAGAVASDLVEINFFVPNGIQGAVVSAFVSSNNTVTVRFDNPTSAAIDLPQGTLTAYVTRP